MCSSYLVLQGAVSNAGRDSTLEAYARSQADLDTLVREQVQQVFANAEVTFSRKAYDRFDQVGVEERYTDENENGSYDIGECYDDSNGNGQWDADRGRTGNGGADDVILYSRSEEHTSERQSLMRHSYAAFCLKKKTTHKSTKSKTQP